MRWNTLHDILTQTAIALIDVGFGATNMLEVYERDDGADVFLDTALGGEDATVTAYVNEGLPTNANFELRIPNVGEFGHIVEQLNISLPYTVSAEIGQHTVEWATLGENMNRRDAVDLFITRILRQVDKT